MTFNLTLVAAKNNLDADVFATLFNFLKEDDIIFDKNINWLSTNKSGFITLDTFLTIEQIQKLRRIFDQDLVDVFCVSQKSRTLFLADMDSTIVTSETLDELADQASLKDKISNITERAMRGELDFHAAITERVGLLKDLPTDALEKTLQDTQISKGATTLLRTLKSNNLFCVLVSGGFTYFTNDIAKQLGFDKNHGNILEIKDNKMTGLVIEPILDKDSKLTYLKTYANELNLTLGNTIAIGDGANDLPMLENAGLGIGYQPKPLVADTILNCIIHTDLTSVLYMQGYKEDAFIK